MTVSTTIRLPDDLRADADAYAFSLGISFNSLCAVALRDYLDARRGLAVVPAAIPASVPVPVVRPSPATVGQKVVSAAAVYAQPAAGVYAPCPCGSGKKWKWCHGGPGA